MFLCSLPAEAPVHSPCPTGRQCAPGEQLFDCPCKPGTHEINQLSPDCQTSHTVGKTHYTVRSEQGQGGQPPPPLRKGGIVPPLLFIGVLYEHDVGFK